DLVLNRFGMAPPLRCTYQEYTLDQEANRRLLAAAILLSRAGLPDAPSSRALRELISHFEGVEGVHYQPARIVPLKRDRRTRAYDPALALAETVLANATVEAISGKTPALAFLVDMNRV